MPLDSLKRFATVSASSCWPESSSTHTPGHGRPGATLFNCYNKYMKKILLIDKPEDWTSFDVVAKVRSTLKNKQHKTNSKQISKKESRTTSGPRLRVGHAGTLDPFATGLLIVLVGEATKEQDSYMKLDKEYEATLKLGYESDTGDTEGAISKTIGLKDIKPNINDIKRTLKKFTGKIKQIPPAHSAIKVDGKRAYKLAREGKEVKLKEREITVHDIEIISYNYPELRIKTKVSSGTYIRSLAQDIGKKLSCGAYLTELRRTKIGKYNIEDAVDIESV